MTCRGCGFASLSTVFVMEPMPIAGAFAETKDAALDAERLPLEWRRCRRCGLVNVWPDVPDEAIYRHYSYRASDVPALRRHHRDFARWLADRFTPRLHYEIGGNDGVLTRYLPWPTVNIDPSDAWVGPGYNEPFTSALARRLPKAELVTASNSLAHFTGIGDAFVGVRQLLYAGGHFVVEVHDLDATLRSEQWDTVYHEHKVEWSADSLAAVGATHGLVLTHIERLALHGGLLRATFVKGERRHVETSAPDFRRLQHAYDTAKAPKLPDGAIAYGAAARATVYLDHVRPDVLAVVDGSPRRHGRFMPGTGLPIIAPSEMGSPPAILVTAWNHFADIRAQHPDYTGDWWTTWRT